MEEPMCESFNRKGIVLVGIALLALATIIFWAVSPQFFLDNGATSQASLSPVSFEQKSVSLTLEEQEYLSRTGTITMCVDPEWEPYELVTPDGEYLGIAADLIGLIADRSGVSLELVQTSDWDESITSSQEGKCQILVFLTQTPARDEWLLFTDP